MAKQVTIKNPILVLLLGASLMTQAAWAQPGGGQGQRRGPPPEAYEACADLVVGDSCTMSGRRGDTLEGSCIVLAEDEDSVVCAPEGGPGGEREAGHSGQ